MARGVNRMDAQDKELKRFGKSINQSGSVDNKPLSLKEQLKQMDTKPNVVEEEIPEWMNDNFHVKARNVVGVMKDVRERMIKENNEKNKKG